MRPQVIHVRASNFLGGPERQLLGHLRVCGGAWYEPVLASFSEGRESVEFLEAAQALGGRTLLLPSRGAFDTAPVRALSRHVQWHPVATLVAHGYKAAAVCEFVSRLTGRPWIGAMRGLTAENRRVRGYEAVELRLLKSARLVVAVSRGTGAMLERKGVHQDRVRLVPNSVDASEWEREPGPLPFGEGYWLVSGRLSPEKNPEAAIEAWLGAGAVRPVVLAGEGPLRPALERRIADLGLGDRVRLVGFQSDVRSLYRGAFGLVLPSLREGLPNVVLEAMASGIPVIATRVGGVPELVEDGVTGLLVEPGDIEGMARAMKRMEGEVELRGRVVQAARAYVAGHYGFRSQRDRWDEVLAEVVRSTPRVKSPLRARWKAGVKSRVGLALGAPAGSPVILTLHRIVDLDDPIEESATCPWMSRGTFEGLLDTLQRNYEVVPLAAIVHASELGRTRIALTFDDGWRDNLEVAAPLLRARDLPWTLFVATGFSGTSRLSWQDRLWLGALEWHRRGDPLPRVWHGLWPGAQARSRTELRDQAASVVARMKRWELGRTEELLAAFGPIGGLPPPSRYLAREELRSLQDSGVEIGSHSVNHVLLSQVTEEEARAELQHSADQLEVWLGTRPVSLAYPNGAVNARVAGWARELGYRIGVTTREARVEADAPPLLLPRLDLDEARVVGLDGNFSEPRLRYEFSRLEG